MYRYLLLSSAVGIAGIFRDFKKFCEYSRYSFGVVNTADIFLVKVYFGCCGYSRCILGAVDTADTFLLVL